MPQIHMLSGMFRRSASLAIPHRKSFAAIPSVSLVLLGHTNRTVSLSHESQREIALVHALSRLLPDYRQEEVEKGSLFRRVSAFDISRAVCIARFESVSASRDTMPLSSHEGTCSKRVWGCLGAKMGCPSFANPTNHPTTTVD